MNKKQLPVYPRIGGCNNALFYRPTWVEISRRNFEENIKAAKAKLKRKAGIVAVVKANAYGHGAEELSRIACKSGCAALGVSSIEEGVALRESGIKSRVLVLGSMYPLENLACAYDYGLIPTISSLQGIKELSALARKRKKRLPFHLKIDTGMGRVGISAASAPAVLNKAAVLKEIALEGIYTHFSAAVSDKEYTKCQLEKFKRISEYARRLDIKCGFHAANSAALLLYPKAHFDLVRPGIMLYGLSPFNGAERQVALKPVLSWKTRIVFLKKVPAKASISYDRTFITKHPSVIATLPVGYADGYNRSLSNKGSVLIRGKRCPVVGRVTMDMIMADVTGVPGVAIGDEVVLIGRQGGQSVTAEEMAQKAGTITYEITCGISYRVPRVHT